MPPAMTQTVRVALPATKQLRDLLESQLGREVSLRPTYPLPPSGRRLAFAIYVDSHLATRAVVVVDLPAAAYIGAAAGLVPVGVATTAVQEHALPALLTDRLHQVASEWARLFARPESADHVRLYNLVLPDDAAPNDIVALAAAPGQRTDLIVSVRAHGEGHLSVVMGR
jgi:hypothetical protein